MNEKTDTKYMPMASKSNSTGIRFHFLQVTAEQTQRFLCCTRGGSSRDLLVWMLLLNTARVCRTQTIKFSPRWRFGVEIDQKTVYRSLKRLNFAGLIDVEFRRGKSPRVTLLPP